MVSREMAEEATSPNIAPSPHCVGREFVRQYYTLLAEAPHYVHRFYSNESIFVHGNEEEIVGQQNICQKIADIGFNGCRTRILALDAHETIGKGIVVQVVGEISVNGELESMRRFVQTFVLAPQSEKKYYVHNDIFRYEDEIFQKPDEKDVDECGPVQDPVTERTIEQRQRQSVTNGSPTIVNDDGQGYYPISTQARPLVTGFPSDVTDVSSAQAMQISYGTQPPLPQRTGSQPLIVEASIHGSRESGANWTTGPSITAASNMRYVPPSPPGQAYAQQQPQPLFTASLPSSSPMPPPPTAPELVTTNAGAATLEPVEAPLAGKESPGTTEDQRDTSAPPARSYANCLKQPKQSDHAILPAAVSPAPPAASPGRQQAPMQHQQGEAFGGPVGNDSQFQGTAGGKPGRWESHQNHPHRQSRASTGEYAGPGQGFRSSPAPSGGPGRGRPLERYPIEQCLFVRYVQEMADEKELRDLLSSHGGRVLELKVVPRQGGGFAYVAMDSVDSARRLIGAKELPFHNDHLIVAQLRERLGPPMGPGGGGQRGGMAGRGDGNRGGGRGIRTFSSRGGGRGGGNYPSY